MKSFGHNDRHENRIDCLLHPHRQIDRYRILLWLDKVDHQIRMDRHISYVESWSSRYHCHPKFVVIPYIRLDRPYLTDTIHHSNNPMYRIPLPELEPHQIHNVNHDNLSDKDMLCHHSCPPKRKRTTTTREIKRRCCCERIYAVKSLRR